jgi:DNA repair protein RecO (recombination protein O)
MALVVTDAIVLHAFDYQDSSRILRIVTRDAGMRSVLARGARRSKRRFGPALDLYAQGTAELQVKPGRDLDTLSAFDVTRTRIALGSELARFTGASVIAELVLRFASDAPDPALFAAVGDAFDQLMDASAEQARDVALGAGWRVLAELGVGPTIDDCAECHAPLDRGAAAMFSHPAGGVLCARCSHLARGGRVLPSRARDALRDWLAGSHCATSDEAEARAHQRLLREFVREHLADDRPLRAFEAWEQGAWSGADA